MTPAPLMGLLLPQLATQISLCSIWTTLKLTLLLSLPFSCLTVSFWSPESVLAMICLKQPSCSAWLALLQLWRPGLFDPPTPPFRVMALPLNSELSGISFSGAL